MAISAIDAIKKFRVKLLKELPLEMPLFFATLGEAGLFPEETDMSIKAKEARIDKVDYFLDHVVRPGADYYLPKLITVMRESEFENLQVLADDIQVSLQPGINFIHIFIYYIYS